MRLFPRALWLALILAVPSGCADEPVVEAPIGADSAPAAAESALAEPAVDPAALRAEIEAVNRQFAEALDRGDVASAVQVYTDDARILPPDMAPAEGRPAIEQFWAGGVQQLGIGGVRLTTEEAEAFGEMAYEQGRYAFTTNQGPAQGKYLVIWSRTPDGWRWRRHIWNPTP